MTRVDIGFLKGYTIQVNFDKPRALVITLTHNATGIVRSDIAWFSLEICGHDHM